MIDSSHRPPPGTPLPGKAWPPWLAIPAHCSTSGHPLVRWRFTPPPPTQDTHHARIVTPGQLGHSVSLAQRIAPRREGRGKKKVPEPSTHRIASDKNKSSNQRPPAVLPLSPFFSHPPKSHTPTHSTHGRCEELSATRTDQKINQALSFFLSYFFFAYSLRAFLWLRFPTPYRRPPCRSDAFSPLIAHLINTILDLPTTFNQSVSQSPSLARARSLSCAHCRRSHNTANHLPVATLPCFEAFSPFRDRSCHPNNNTSVAASAADAAALSYNSDDQPGKPALPFFARRPAPGASAYLCTASPPWRYLAPSQCLSHSLGFQRHPPPDSSWVSLGLAVPHHQRTGADKQSTVCCYWGHIPPNPGPFQGGEINPRRYLPGR